MGSGLDAFLKEMQKKIDEETREDFGEIVYQRWQNPLYMGVMDNPDGSAIVRGTCGDAMQIFLKIQNDRVVQASFQTDGCGPTVVCGSYAVEMSLQKRVEDLFSISGQVILSRLGGLPPEHRHCAFLAAESLQAAADDYMVKQTKKAGIRKEELSGSS